MRYRTTQTKSLHAISFFQKANDCLNWHRQKQYCTVTICTALFCSSITDLKCVMIFTDSKWMHEPAWNCFCLQNAPMDSELKTQYIQQCCSSQKFHGPGASGDHSKLQTWPPSSAGWRDRFYHCWLDQHGKPPSSGWHGLQGTWPSHKLLINHQLNNTLSAFALWRAGVGLWSIKDTSWQVVGGRRSSSDHPCSPASGRSAWHGAWSTDKGHLCDLQYDKNEALTNQCYFMHT